MISFEIPPVNVIVWMKQDDLIQFLKL